MNSYAELLMWVKGPAFDIAVFIFIAGVFIRLLEILILGRKKDYSKPRSSEVSGAVRSIIKLPSGDTVKRAPFTVIMGFIWHIAWFVTFLFFIPHIEMLNDLIGISWPGLPNQVIDAATVIGIISLLAVLIHRMTHPVLSFISTKEDYVVWLITFLPLLTGYLAYHHTFEPYTLLLALHILSIELLLVVFPFTKLMHAITVFMARWFNGAINGRKEELES